MSETGRKSKYSVSMSVREKGIRPLNYAYRMERLNSWGQAKIVNDLFPLLGRLSEGAEEDATPSCFPLIVPMRLGMWRPDVVITVLTPHLLPVDEVAAELLVFLRQFAHIAIAALDPLPPAESCCYLGDHPKRSVGFLSHVHWTVPKLA